MPQPGRRTPRPGCAAPAQLRQQAGDVVLDRLLGQKQALADLPVGETLGDEVEDAALLIGEFLQGRIGGWASRSRVRTCCVTTGFEQRLPLSHSVDRIEQLGAVDLLQHVARGTLPSGSRPSRMATSGRSAGIRLVASTADPDSPTTLMLPSDSTSSWSPQRTIS